MCLFMHCIVHTQFDLQTHRGSHHCSALNCDLGSKVSIQWHRESIGERWKSSNSGTWAVISEGSIYDHEWSAPLTLLFSYFSLCSFVCFSPPWRHTRAHRWTRSDLMTLNSVTISPEYRWSPRVCERNCRVRKSICVSCPQMTDQVFLHVSVSI